MDVEAIVARGLQVLAALGGAYVLALWFVLAVWTFRDIEARSRSVVTQIFSTLLVVLFFVPGLLLYWVLRPKDTLDEAFGRSLEEEYLLQDLEELPLCPKCQHYMADDFVLCPHCHAQLRESCPSCTRLVDLRWSLCPYCGVAQDGREAEVAAIVEAPEPRWIAPALRRKRVTTPVKPEAQPEVAAATTVEAAPTGPVPLPDLGDTMLPDRRIARFRPSNGATPAEGTAMSAEGTVTTAETASANGSSNGHHPNGHAALHDTEAMPAVGQPVTNGKEPEPAAEPEPVALGRRFKID